MLNLFLDRDEKLLGGTHGHPRRILCLPVKQFGEIEDVFDGHHVVVEELVEPFRVPDVLPLRQNLFVIYDWIDQRLDYGSKVKVSLVFGLEVSEDVHLCQQH